IYFDRYTKQSITEYYIFFNEEINNRIVIRSFSPLTIEFEGTDLPSVNESIDYNHVNGLTGWHHVSIGYSFNRIKMYLDGILVVDGAMSLKPKNVSLFGK